MMRITKIATGGHAEHFIEKSKPLHLFRKINVKLLADPHLSDWTKILWAKTAKEKNGLRTSDKRTCQVFGCYPQIQ